MSRHLFILCARLPVLAGCAQHGEAWDEARAQCQGEAIQQIETAGVPDDQKPTWRENYIRECVRSRGFEE